jgi:hypothetical protein
MKYIEFKSKLPQLIEMQQGQSTDEHLDILQFYEVISGLDYDILLRKTEAELQPYAATFLQFQGIMLGEFMSNVTLKINGKKYKVNESANNLLKVGHMQAFKQVSTNIMRTIGTISEDAADSEKMAYVMQFNRLFIENADYLAAIMLEPKVYKSGNVTENIEGLRVQLEQQPFYEVISTAFFLAKQQTGGLLTLAGYFQAGELSTAYRRQVIDYANTRSSVRPAMQKNTYLSTIL